jgi:FkbM family methyltransferase
MSREHLRPVLSRLKRGSERQLDHEPEPQPDRLPEPRPETAVDPVELAVQRDRMDVEHMRRLLAFVLSPDACCVDVGAHRGAILQELVRVAPRGRHIAFEPLPHLAEMLRSMFPDVDVRTAALSDHPGETSFTQVRGIAEGCSGFSAVTVPPEYASDIEEIQVKLEVLDDLLPPGYRMGLLKIDVEGAEEQVLRGAVRTLKRDRPTVILEHSFAAANAYGTEPADIYGLLCDEAGLRIFDLDGNGPYDRHEFELASHAGERVNYAAHV